MNKVGVVIFNFFVKRVYFFFLADFAGGADLFFFWKKAMYIIGSIPAVLNMNMAMNHPS